LHDEDHIWHLISVCLTKDATDEESKTLEKIVNEQPDLKIMVQQLIQYWNAGIIEDTAAIDNAWAAHLKKMITA
jgi:hypothetical protein